MKYLFFFIATLFFIPLMNAQHGYTYISDRRFFSPEDLVGYDFKPDRMEVPNVSEKNLTPGEYSFGVNFNNLFIEGEGIRGVFNINNISPTEYGFKLLLINARDARLQGHLKIIQNKWGMVEALIYKRSPTDKETIFYLPPIPGKLNTQERDYFTDRGELVIEHTDSLWGKTFYPFFRIHLEKNIQEPLEISDSTSVTFIRTITLELKEKEKKKKEKKNREIEVLTEDAVQDTLEQTTETEEYSFIDGQEISSSEEKHVDQSKYKIIKKYAVEVRSILQYEDGTKEDKKWNYPIRKVVEREDELAKMDEERFQIDISSDKGKQIYLYLTGDKTVSTFEFNNQLFLMRGF
ncbi:hypothetical protein OAF63_05225 [Saprospiraceae bacterium]|jgi:hypothetical protein|nr:hypothetical protein [Bacteroidota bacterium]MDB4728176.1 hypothetical protein [Saprospiraceae bacterium]MDF1863374.1 hypothetical protein [Saprospiraceae bacterium]